MGGKVVKMMGRSMRTLVTMAAVVVVMMRMEAVEAATAAPKLEWHYYKVHNTCRYVEEYVRHEVQIMWHSDHSITPKLLRLLYSDCFVTVCPPPYITFPLSFLNS